MLLELKDTVEGMLSLDYKERFRAEWQQAEIRKNKLELMLHKWEQGMLDFVPTCPKCLLEKQLSVMKELCDIYETRFVIEK